MRPHRSTWALASYAVIVFAFRLGLERSSVGQALGARLPYALASFALLLAPLWLFGFDAGEWLRERLASSLVRAFCGVFLVIPYVVFTIRGGEFQWTLAILMAGLPVVLAGLLLSSPSSKMAWQDIVVLGTLVAVYMLHVIAGAWNFPNLAALPKLYVADVTLYLYVMVRGLPGIGYSFIPQVSDFLIGFQEWLFFLPFGIGLGFALRFIHFHARLPSPMTIATDLLVTFVLIAIPEEMFFRGVLQNLLESRFPSSALGITAVLFGLSHFNKGAFFNWRYVLLASIAGVFYGRAWNSRHRVLASVLTHTAVDVAWSLWFR